MEGIQQLFGISDCLSDFDKVAAIGTHLKSASSSICLQKNVTVKAESPFINDENL